MIDLSYDLKIHIGILLLVDVPKFPNSNAEYNGLYQPQMKGLLTLMHQQYYKNNTDRDTSCIMSTSDTF